MRSIILSVRCVGVEPLGRLLFWYLFQATGWWVRESYLFEGNLSQLCLTVVKCVLVGDGWSLWAVKGVVVWRSILLVFVAWGFLQVQFVQTQERGLILVTHIKKINPHYVTVRQQRGKERYWKFS